MWAECDICMEAFDDSTRLPKLLPCHHTVCLDCLPRMQTDGFITCPMDRKVFALDVPTDLPDNLFIKGKLDNAACDSGQPRKRFRGASDGEADDSPQLRLLESLASRREELLAALRAVWDGLLSSMQERMLAEKQLLKCTRDCMEGLQGEQHSSARAQELRREAAGLLHAGAALEQDLQLLQPRLASVSVEGGWQSQRVQLSEQPALQVAALHLRQRDCLGWKPSQQEQQQEDDSQELQAQQELPTALQRFNVSTMTSCPSDALAQEKQDLLCSPTPIHMLSFVWGNKDPDFSPALLWRNAAHLEEVHLYAAGRSHLLAVQSMRRLRKLQVHEVSDRTMGPLPAQPPRGMEDGDSGLTWLQLLAVPRDTARSIIAANGHSLRKLRLGVGPPSKAPSVAPPAVRVDNPPAADWVRHCDDLEDFLRDCELQRLKSLTLVRTRQCRRPAWCSGQLYQARRALPPDCRVRCTVCRVWVTGNY